MSPVSHIQNHHWWEGDCFHLNRLHEFNHCDSFFSMQTQPIVIYSTKYGQRKNVLMSKSSPVTVSLQILMDHFLFCFF